MKCLSDFFLQLSTNVSPTRVRTQDIVTLKKACWATLVTVRTITLEIIVKQVR